MQHPAAANAGTQPRPAPEQQCQGGGGGDDAGRRGGRPHPASSSAASVLPRNGHTPVRPASAHLRTGRQVPPPSGNSTAMRQISSTASAMQHSCSDCRICATQDTMPATAPPTRLPDLHHPAHRAHRSSADVPTRSAPPSTPCPPQLRRRAYRICTAEHTRPEASAPMRARSPTGDSSPLHCGWKRAPLYGSSTYLLPR